jgi:hypothetical protein
VRPVFRLALILAVAALSAPAAQAAPTSSTPAPAPGSPFSAPVQDLVGQATTEETTTVSKPKGEDNGRGTLLFLSLVALVLIAGVAGFIWYEGRQMGGTQRKRRRQRLRSGRTPQPATAGSGTRRGPPPPPRKRRAQAAKRKKR